MAYNDKFPSNQRNVTPNPLKPESPTPNTPQPPLARVQQKAVDTSAIGDGFKKMGNNLVRQEIPNLFHRILHGIVDAIFPGSSPTPFVGRSNYSNIYSNMMSGRSSMMPIQPRQQLYGQPQTTGEVLSARRSFDVFMLPDRQTAMDIFQGLISDALQAGYLTVSQVYDRLRLPCSYMGVQYYWTADDISSAEINETPTGECRVKMPKAHLIK